MIGRPRKYIQPKVKVGQVWKEYSCKRPGRWIIVVSIINEDYVRIKTIKTKGKRKLTRHIERVAYIERFNGDAKGYRYFGIPNENKKRRAS